MCNGFKKPFWVKQARTLSAVLTRIEVVNENRQIIHPRLTVEHRQILHAGCHDDLFCRECALKLRSQGLVLRAGFSRACKGRTWCTGCSCASALLGIKMTYQSLDETLGERE